MLPSVYVILAHISGPFVPNNLVPFLESTSPKKGKNKKTVFSSKFRKITGPSNYGKHFLEKKEGWVFPGRLKQLFYGYLYR